MEAEKKNLFAVEKLKTLHKYCSGPIGTNFNTKFVLYAEVQNNVAWNL